MIGFWRRWSAFFTGPLREKRQCPRPLGIVRPLPTTRTATTAIVLCVEFFESTQGSAADLHIQRSGSVHFTRVSNVEPTHTMTVGS